MSKLISTLHSKNNYLIDFRMLKECLKQGIVLKSVNNYIRFQQKAWLKPYTKLRQKAQNDFKKDFYKLMNNLVYGKQMENVRKRYIVKILTSLESFLKQGDYETRVVLDEETVLLHIQNKTVKLNKPIFGGTEGFWQLLTLKKPDLNVYIDEDLENYKKLILNTNVYLGKNNKILSSGGHKCKNFIQPILIESGCILSKPSGPDGSGLNIAHLNKILTNKSEKIYWNKPEELINRTEILLGEWFAGNNNPQTYDEIIVNLKALGYKTPHHVTNKFKDKHWKKPEKLINRIEILLGEWFAGKTTTKIHNKIISIVEELRRGKNFIVFFKIN